MGFPSTHWTVILGARDQTGTQAEDALASLCATYWYPLYAYIRRRGAGPQEAEDLTQGFFCHFLERQTLSRVHPAAGKFRSFLLGCLKKFLGKEWERARAQRRGGGCQPVALDGEEAEMRCAAELADSLTPDALFERRWAITVLEQTMAAMRQEYSAGEKRALFEDLQGFLFAGREDASRAELAARRGVSVGAIDVAIHRLKKRFGALLRNQVARTVSSEEEVDEEIRHLISVVSV
jgi:DNA-directed RNA polymerase specialized sigma24 family protein